MLTLLLIVFLILISSPVLYWYYVQWKFRNLRKIPGPEPMIFLGNKFPSDPSEIFKLLISYTEIYGKLFKIWTGPIVRVLMMNPDDIETVMTSNEHITKSPAYSLIRPWLGDGLLLSTGEKWKSRRKMLTPAFHFKILEQFLDVFNQSSRRLVKKFEPFVGAEELDVYDLINLHSLDIICETSMGTKMNAINSTGHKYANAVLGILKILGERYLSPWKQINFLFDRFANTGKLNTEYIKTAHDFTLKVIKDRISNQETPKNEKCDEFGIKSKFCLIDTLIKPENNLSLEDIRSETDTFMFEGHDTTASAQSFALYALAQNPDIQEKVYQEILEVVGLKDVDITINHLNEMKYLEMVIKECLRVYPSVPLIERQLEKDFTVGDFTYPKGTILILGLYNIGKDKENFPNPEKFDPLRFTPDNIAKRHKFSYAPFSAGPRNCIGQKFAMYQMKTTLIYVLKKFKILPVPGHKLLLSGTTGILKSFSGTKVRLENRK